jgi:hypothetical protein
MNYEVKTPNHRYRLTVIETFQPFHKMKYSVGSSRKPCLELSVFLPDIDKRLQHIIYTASLSKIDALKECMLDDKDETSFGLELLYSILGILKVNHPYIKTVALHDSSYIPCNREDGDTLDLLSYSIALYGKTWYEKKAGAHLEGEKDRELYKTQIQKYLSDVPQDTLPFSKFYEKIIRNDFAAEKITTIKDVEEQYKLSRSFPDFFTYLNSQINRYERCRFFKDWLEEWIGSQIVIRRDWQINIEENSILGSVLDTPPYFNFS